jgi:hypothetical protein
MYKSQYLLLGILLLFPYRSAKGTMIISTFGAGNSYSFCCGFGNVAPTQMAYPFIISPGPNFIFTSAELALSEGIGSTNAVDISLANDASDLPGAVLETFHLDNALGPAGANNPPVVVNSLLGPLLLAGSQYWLIESPSASGNGVNWGTAFIAPNPAQRAAKNGTGPWTVSAIDNFSDPGAFSISGTVASAPEPSSLTLVGAGLMLLSAAGLWRSQKTASPSLESTSPHRRPL